VTTPSAAAWIGVPVAAAMLMPSLRWPPPVEPKPAMILPLTGTTKPEVSVSPTRVSCTA